MSSDKNIELITNIYNDNFDIFSGTIKNISYENNKSNIEIQFANNDLYANLIDKFKKAQSEILKKGNN
jgi:hypothetical protein